MSPPQSKQELAERIEAIVAEYMAEGRRAAEEAVARAFSTAMVEPTKRPATSKPPATKFKPIKRAAGKPRLPEEIAGLGEQLHELVCARPGESMVVFAAELGVSVQALHWPMKRLKRDGRVRSVGERQHTRYFPALGAKARA